MNFPKETASWKAEIMLLNFALRLKKAGARSAMNVLHSGKLITLPWANHSNTVSLTPTVFCLLFLFLILMLQLLSMRIIVTGTPGTGKTAVAKLLGKRLKCRVINEHDFCMGKKIGRFEHGELVVPLGKFQKALNAELKKRRNIIAEGHLLCEIKLNADAAILLRLHPELLEARLERRGYNAEKIQDNVFCEGIDYCKKHLNRNYRRSRIIEVSAHGTAKETANIIFNKLKAQLNIG